MYLEENITFIEKPATNDEKAIADIFKKMARAVEKKDLELFFSLICPEALIVLPPFKKSMNKEEYGEYIKEAFGKIRRVIYKNIRIQLAEKTKAFAYCQSYILVYGSNLPEKTERHFIFSKKEGEWYITHITYFFSSSNFPKIVQG